MHFLAMGRHRRMGLCQQAHGCVIEKSSHDRGSLDEPVPVNTSILRAAPWRPTTLLEMLTSRVSDKDTGSPWDALF